MYTCQHGRGDMFKSNSSFRTLLIFSGDIYSKNLPTKTLFLYSKFSDRWGAATQLLLTRN